MNIEEIKREILDGKPLDERLALALAMVRPIGPLQDKGGALSTFAGGGMCPSCGL